MTEILHLTAHLGGGVGQALSTLVVASGTVASPVRHVMVCLEKPEKNKFLDQIRTLGVEVLICPDELTLRAYILRADIVQLEWWNHPATIEALCGLDRVAMRLLVWCHVSGLHNPIIPSGLLAAAGRFVLTSPCSLTALGKTLSQEQRARLSVISSAAGVDALPRPSPRRPRDTGEMSVGYLGSLNFAKLHPDYVKFLSSVQLPGFNVRLIGDELNRDTLERQCRDVGRPGLLDFHGYAIDVAAELTRLDVLAYLLNPRHYGTAENALVESMAMGVVPVVLDNPAERCIVEHGETGLIVSDPVEFSSAMEWLAAHPEQRLSMGQRAASVVRESFSGAKTRLSFRNLYEAMLAEPKHDAHFKEIFGATPEAWFLSCQERQDIFTDDGQIDWPPGEKVPLDLLEQTKGSVFHFERHFPRSDRLRAWARRIEKLS